ncbi:MAG: hypothetical protein HY069_02455 [Chlamydiia bacterium]|nr:hypothetical protein [Chlamydiia bacterium]
MKEIKTHYSQVLANLNNFRSFLHEKHLEKGKKLSRSYPVWVDEKTGIMEFSKKGEIHTHAELHLIVQQSRGQKTQFKIEGKVADEVDKIIEETLNALNLLAELAIHKLPEEQILQDISAVHLERWGDKIEKFPGWKGSCNRQEAERQLNRMPKGTYLLRKAESLTDWMLSQYPLHTKGYVLTVVEDEEKISDYLILKTDRGWTLHRDDADLTDYRYDKHLSSLLASMHEIAATPIE